MSTAKSSSTTRRSSTKLSPMSPNSTPAVAYSIEKKKPRMRNKILKKVGLKKSTPREPTLRNKKLNRERVEHYGFHMNSIALPKYGWKKPTFLNHVKRVKKTVQNKVKTMKNGAMKTLKLAPKASSKTKRVQQLKSYNL